MLRIELETEMDYGAVVVARGELLGFDARRLVHSVAVLLRSGASAIVVDLRNVDYVDSGGMSALIASWRTAARNGVPFGAVLGENAEIRTLLRFYGVGTLFPVRVTDDALEGVGSLVG